MPGNDDVFIDNYDNNRAGASLLLSDLHACKVPLQMKILHGEKKTKKVDFASFEHAWCARRMIRHPDVGASHTVVTVQHMQLDFVTTQEDALCFLAQFEQDGVFASWKGINEYYPANLICSSVKGAHNIGLIARFVCSNNVKAERIRSRIRRYAADHWKNTGNAVAHSIACCLWRGSPNMSSYKTGLAIVAKAKYARNSVFRNELVMSRGLTLLTTFVACDMVTATRKKSSTVYMHTLSCLAAWLDWQLPPQMLLALVMGFHSRLGQHSLLSQINIDTMLTIIAPLLDTQQEKKIKKHFTKTHAAT